MNKIIILGDKSNTTRYVYNGLNPDFFIEKVIIEEPVSKKQLIKRRIQKLGIITVLGQLIFQVMVSPIVKFFSKNRIKEIEEKYLLNCNSIPNDKLIYVHSINDDNCIKLIKDINPQLIIVNGTRIISKKVLKSTTATFINTHVGITPKYRGVHGGYWALANNDKKNCGVTVHLVDAGIDTGGILYQSTITVDKKDTFATYSILQYAAAIPLLKQAISDVINQSVRIKEGTKESILWYHPTVWQYIYNFILKKVK